MADRKIIQVAAMPMTDNDNVNYPASIVALADDGSVWELNYNLSKAEWGKWQQLPELPKS